MKIVLTTHHYPPTFVAGVELITERHARWLHAHGHEVQVVCVESINARLHGSVRTDIQDGITVHRLGLALAGTGEHLGVRFKDDVLSNWMVDYLSSWRPDVIHSHSSYLLTASLVEVAKQCGVPVIATLHDYWFLCPRITLRRSDGTRCTANVSAEDCTRCVMGEQRRYRVLDRMRVPWPMNTQLLGRIEERQSYLDRILRDVDQIISPAPLARELLLERGFPPDAIKLIRYGLDPPQVCRPARERRSGGLRIGYLGQLAPHKGVDLLIRAFLRLRPCESGAPELRIHGNPVSFPGYSGHLRKLAGDNSRIRFYGGYDNHRAEEVLRDIDVLVVPSTWFEISPLVIMESFSAGVPVVASRLPNLQYQVAPEVDGLLFEPDDTVDLGRQLQRMVDDRELVERFARGIRPVRTIDDEMAELQDVYCSVIGSSRRSYAYAGSVIATQ